MIHHNNNGQQKTISVELPKWTVLYNINCGKFVGTAHEFYTNEKDAQDRYVELAKSDKYCPTKRPYNNSADFAHLGAAHQFLINNQQ